MNYKKFNYKNYKNCYFEVGTYLYNPFAMSIKIVNARGDDITMVTVNMKDYVYYPGSATIRNYSENSGMTEFLRKLGIIGEIYTRKRCNPQASKNETIDFCEINVDKLKEYSKEFEYEW